MWPREAGERRAAAGEAGAADVPESECVPRRGTTGAYVNCARDLLLAVLLVGCGSRPAGGPDGVPGRVVTLAPSATEIVYALGAGERVVGVCAQCDYPPAAARVPRVGGYLTPSVEAVLAARPDLVIAVPSPGNREAVYALERAGVRVLVVQDRLLADLWDGIHTIAAALDLAPDGERLIADVRGRLDAIVTRVRGLPRRRVLVVVGHNPLVAVGGDTLQDELITLAGGSNVAGDTGRAWPTLTLEVVIERAPDVIVDAAMGDERGGAALFTGLDTVPAVRAGRVVTLPSDALLRTGPR